MGAIDILKNVARTNVATATNTIGATQQSATVIQNGTPTGDMLLKDVSIRISGNLNLAGAGPAGSINNLGGLKFLRNFKLESDHHGVPFIDGLDGRAISDIEYCKRATRQTSVDIGSAADGTPTFEYNLTVPFYNEDCRYPFENAIDLWNNRLRAESLFGVVGDFFGNTTVGSAGTYTTQTVQVLNQKMSMLVKPGPISKKDAPLFQPSWGSQIETISATATRYRVQLPYNDRLYDRIWVQQYQSANHERLNNTIIGVNDTDSVSLMLNSAPVFDNITWLELQNRNARDFNISSMPPGLACFDFTKKMAGGYDRGSALNVISPQSGQLEFYADVTTGTSTALYFYFEAYRPINSPAIRVWPEDAPSVKK